VREERSPLNDAIDYRMRRKDKSQLLRSPASRPKNANTAKSLGIDVSTLRKAVQLLLFACAADVEADDMIVYLRLV
jgi:hypothetical protein